MISIVQVRLKRQTISQKVYFFLVELDCYRKKQRGDCNSLQFQRAASERGDYIYSHRHPDQPSSISNPHRPIQHDLSRHPSWTLHQLDRQFLSLQPPTTNIAEVWLMLILN